MDLNNDNSTGHPVDELEPPMESAAEDVIYLGWSGWRGGNFKLWKAFNCRPSAMTVDALWHLGRGMLLAVGVRWMILDLAKQTRLSFRRPAATMCYDVLRAPTRNTLNTCMNNHGMMSKEA